MARRARRLPPAIFVAMCLLVGCRMPTRVSNVVYVFPEGFRGEWYLIPDPSLPKRGGGGTITLAFNKRGFCRVDSETFEAVSDFASRTGRVGTKEIPLIENSQFTAGRVGFTFSNEAVDPAWADRISFYHRGVVGDAKDLLRSENRGRRELGALLREAENEHKEAAR